jgi:hypothetical protein
MMTRAVTDVRGEGGLMMTTNVVRALADVEYKLEGTTYQMSSFWVCGYQQC